MTLSMLVDMVMTLILTIKIYYIMTIMMAKSSSMVMTVTISSSEQKMFHTNISSVVRVTISFKEPTKVLHLTMILKLVCFTQMEAQETTLLSPIYLVLINKSPTS